jgi:DHA2 family multidrug resistance protein
VPTIVQGIAMAFFFIPLVTITLSGIAPDRIPAASGMSNFMRITAGAFGTSIATTLWEDRAALHHAQLVEVVSSGRQVTGDTLAGLAAAGLSPERALGQVNRLIDQQAFMLSSSEIFFASALAFIALIPLVWLTRPRPAGAPGGGGANDAAGAH